MKLKHIYNYFALILLSSCANIIAPNGGPKDQNSPLIKKKDIKFFENETQINITFNERIEKDQNTRTFLMPGRVPAKTEQISGSSLQLLFPIKIDSTADISLMLEGNLKDITENNSFQTSYIPIQSIGPKTKYNIETYIPWVNNKKILYFVTGYNPDDEKDSAINKINYWYAAEGTKLLTPPLPNQNVIICAVIDDNNNLKPDSGEYFDYYPISNTADSIYNVSLFPGKDPTLNKYDILYYCQHYGVFTFLIYPPGQNLRLVDNNIFTHESYIQKYKGPICDTLIWYNPDADYPVGYFDLYVNHQWFRDLQSIHINNPGIRRPFYIYPPNTDTIRSVKDTLFFSFSNAIQSFDYKKVKLKINNKYIKPNIYWFNRQHTVAAIIPDSNFTDSTHINITFEDSAIEDVFMQKNDKYTFNIYNAQTITEDSTGSITFTSPIFNSDSLELSIGIMDENGNKLEQDYRMYGQSTYYFSGLIPGQYRLLIYKDLNKNARRDGPWFYGKKMAEPFVVSEPVEIIRGMSVEIPFISLDNFGKR